VLDALHAEWTKLRTLAGTYWLVFGVAALTVAVSSAVVAAASVGSSSGYQDTTKLALTGIDVGQAVVVILAVGVFSNEYSTGMIGVTLAAVPRRGLVVAAKAALVLALVLASGALAVLASVVIGRFVLPGGGFTAAHGYALLSLAHGPTLRAATGSVLYLGLIGLLSLGVALVVRDTAIAVGVVLGLLLLFPILAASVNDPTWKHYIERIGPMTAGLSVQATTGLKGLAISPWGGLGVVALWAAGALVAGVLVFKLRDA